ncbi:MAG: acyltransferase [Thermoleophilaceae bacterium]
MGETRFEGLREYAREPVKRAALRARVQRPWRRLRFHSFGERSVLDRPEFVYGAYKIAIGDDVVILRGAWLSVEKPAWDEGEEPALRIGDRVAIRPRVAISATQSVVIEDDVLIAKDCSIVDSDHSHAGPAENVLYNPVEASPIRIGQGTWLGDRVSVLRGSDIGRHCTIGAGSVVRGQIPDYSVAVGAPARVVGSTR